MVAPAFLTGQVLTDDEELRRVRLLGQLSRARVANERQERYYEGNKRVEDLGIAIPPHLVDAVDALTGWPETVVDVLDERMDWRGWLTPGLDLGLAEVAEANHLDVKVQQGGLDSLICGVSYLVVGTGGAGEPEVLVTAESPNRMTATWDPRLWRCADALAETYDDREKATGWVLYLPEVTVTAERQHGRVVVVERDEHGLGRVPVSALVNRPRTARHQGRSEITRTIRSLTNEGMRTLLGMEITREFYGSTQRYLMGADEKFFVDSEGKPKSGWEAVLGKMLAVPRDEKGNVPTAGQFPVSTPQPYSEILLTLSKLVSAASGVPAHHLGFTTDNPASADAIMRADGRLDKRAIRRGRQYDQGLVDCAENVVLWRDGELPPAGSIRSHWSDPATPTPAASADRTMKLITAGVLSPDSDVTYEGLGFSPVDIARIRADRLRSVGRSSIADLAAAAAAARANMPAPAGM